LIAWRIQDAIDCAARMAKVTEYRLKEYPEPQSFFEKYSAAINKLTRVKPSRKN
jgi:protease-4